jgi:peptidase M28-like protein
MSHGRRAWVWWAALAFGLAACGVSCEAAPRFAVDGARALRRVAFQVEAGPRLPGTPGHERVRAWIESEMKRLGGRVETQRFTDHTFARPEELANVIGHWGPKGGGGPIVLCAHYDTRAMCDEDPDPAHRNDPMPGANDAGSGVAVLLEVAELMSRRAPGAPVDLVFFDGEDQGLPSKPDTYSRGARGYAARLPTPGPRAAFLFDMVGDKNLAIYPERTSEQRAASLVDLVLEAARATGAQGFHAGARYQLSDDHEPLLQAGVPAVDIIDFDYPAWHTHRDLPDQVSAESLAEVSKVAAWLVYSSPLSRLR